MSKHVLIIGAMLAAVIASTADASAQSSDTAPLQLEAKIPLGDVVGRLDHFALDPHRHHLFIAELENNSVGVIDLNGRKTIHTIRGLPEPQGLAYVASGDALYVANAGDGSVRLFRAGSFSPAGKFDLGADADNIRIDAEKNLVLVGYGTGALAVIDPVTRQKTADIPLDAHPESFQISTSTDQIFVNLPKARSIAVLDLMTGQRRTSWRMVHEANFPMALDEDNQRVIVVFRKPAKLSVFAQENGKLVAERDACGDADDVFFDAKRQRIYISCGAGVIEVFSTEANAYQRVARITTVAGARTSLFLPGMDRLVLGVRATDKEPAAVWIYRVGTLSRASAVGEERNDRSHVQAPSHEHPAPASSHFLEVQSEPPARRTGQHSFSNNFPTFPCGSFCPELTLAARGNAGSPSDGSTVQALRNTRRVEEIAHGRSTQSNWSRRSWRTLATAREVVMPLKILGVIEIPASAGSSFDHGAFDARSRRVFVAHTGRNSVEVIDHDAGRHSATLPGFPEAAGVVADDGQVLVTNRGAASLAWLDAHSLQTRATFKTGPRPNGVAVVAQRGLAIAACIGDETHTATLHVLGLDGSRRHSIDLPGRPRWCVTDATTERLFLAIREPSMVLVARLPELDNVQHWKLPSAGAHGLDIDHQRGRLYLACDDGALIEVDIGAGMVRNKWPIAGVPDATFYNPATGLVHVAIGEPGLVQTIDPRTGDSAQVMTGSGAHTTALVAPDRLYVFSPVHRGILVLADG